MEAWEHHQRLDRDTPFADLEWRAVGPMQAGARIEAIAVPAGSPETIYVGVRSVNVIQEDPEVPGALCLGTDRGVFASGGSK
jgi:hypothetical protein